MTLIEHAELQELLGAYALHALDDHEVDAVEAHLPTCPQCRAEVDDFREVTALLAQTGAPAPGNVWDRIAEEIGGETPPPLRLVLGDRPARPGPVAPGASQRWRRSLTAVAVAAAVALVGAVSFQLAREPDRGGGTDSERAVAVFAAADSRRSELSNATGDVLAVAAVLPSGEGFVRADDLPDLPDGVYQLWGQIGDEAISLGVLDRRGELYRFNATDDMTALMITAEETPVVASSNPPVVVGELA
ncbi:MAG: anti-sigma factor [Acidimicrobiia bacterium]|nr:anti-sigma factor [Acidimicrobiia bacterium]